MRGAFRGEENGICLKIKFGTKLAGNWIQKVKREEIYLENTLSTLNFSLEIHQWYNNSRFLWFTQISNNCAYLVPALIAFQLFIVNAVKMLKKTLILDYTVEYSIHKETKIELMWRGESKVPIVMSQHQISMDFIWVFIWETSTQ